MCGRPRSILSKTQWLRFCNTVKDTKGEKTDFQVQGEVPGQLSGLLGRLARALASGTGSLTDEFAGLTQDATAIALTGDRECRERLFDKITGGALIQHTDGTSSPAQNGNGNSVIINNK
jgi:hypothetical protein